MRKLSVVVPTYEVNKCKSYGDRKHWENRVRRSRVPNFSISDQVCVLMYFMKSIKLILFYPFVFHSHLFLIRCTITESAIINSRDLYPNESHEPIVS